MTKEWRDLIPVSHHVSEVQHFTFQLHFTHDVALGFLLVPDERRLFIAFVSLWSFAEVTCALRSKSLPFLTLWSPACSSQS